MSIPVDLADLERALGAFGSGHLATVSEGGSVKIVTVDPVVEGEGLLVRGPGGGTLRNLAGNPALTVLFPPTERHGFALLVDGTGAVDGEDVRIAPTGAVLHRPRAHADGPPPPFEAPAPAAAGDSACGHECGPVA
ncbi:pyridoxamine 5'-phosphate oxidase [Nocardioides flavescens]|uniref:pyridoxamine 5'-phosphate oxidase n=1 Tax=Nocardioides flavescens TaxID=2691959 RepID=UPI001928804B|nr:pyridoxamine 5'-phosphate oxidase [Nocardioides flavescens]